MMLAKPDAIYAHFVSECRLINHVANDLRVAAFELSGGIREQLSGKHATFEASQVVSYGQDVLVVPDDVAQTLS